MSVAPAKGKQAGVYFHMCLPCLAAGSDWKNSRGDLAGSAGHELGNFQTSFGRRDGRAPCELGSRRILKPFSMPVFFVRRKLSCVGAGVSSGTISPSLVALYLCTVVTDFFCGFHHFCQATRGTIHNRIVFTSWSTWVLFLCFREIYIYIFRLCFKYIFRLLHVRFHAAYLSPLPPQSTCVLSGHSPD